MFSTDFLSGSAGVRFVLSGLILCVSGLLAEDHANPSKPKTPPPVSKGRAAGQQGMTISRDPDSGQLQSGTRDLAPPPSNVTVGGAPQPVQLPNGMVMIEATSDHMSTSVVSRNADGTLTYQCIDGKAKAEAVVKKIELEAKQKLAAQKEKTGDR